jgi:hypothetical protein
MNTLNSLSNKSGAKQKRYRLSGWETSAGYFTSQMSLLKSLGMHQ